MTSVSHEKLFSSLKSPAEVGFLLNIFWDKSFKKQVAENRNHSVSALSAPSVSTEILLFSIVYISLCSLWLVYGYHLEKQQKKEKLSELEQVTSQR